VNLPAPVLSRFDLILMMLDEPDEEVDYNIAWHIVNLHALYVQTPCAALLLLILSKT
jgi:DNA replication licensing factor MCM6